MTPRERMEQMIAGLPFPAPWYRAFAESIDEVILSRAKEATLLDALGANVTALCVREASLVGLLRECYPHVKFAAEKLIELGIESVEEQHLLARVREAIK